MIIKHLITQIKVLSLPIRLQSPAQSFVLLKMLKKKLKDKEERFKPRAETYTATEAEKKQKQQQLEDHAEPQYDFFSRQKEIELNQDYRKIRQQSQFIPKDIGKGGFDEVVYWSEFAKTPEQIIDLVKVFNRIKMPQQIGDKFRFQQFGDKVMKTVYLSNNLNTLQEFATFGERFSINEETYWKKIEEKATRINPKTPEQIKDCIQIAFIMSKMDQGETIYSSLSTIFKNMEITPEDTAKLLLVYSNTESGDKHWVEQLLKKLIQNLDKVRKQVVVQLLTVFKKSKNIPNILQRKIQKRIEDLIPQFEFKELCLAAGFIGHGKMPQIFWKKVEKRAQEVIPQKKSTINTMYILQLISSYSLTTQFVNKYFVPSLRENKYKALYDLSPQILAGISKTLYIYQLENETKDIEEFIQTKIIKVYNDLKNVQIQCLIKVIKDYSVTRIGSRELYIFLQQVADALFEEIKKDREMLSTLCTVYENSKLCSPQFLEKLEYNVQ